MNKKSSIITSISAALLCLLWSYTAASKLMDLSRFHSEMRNQVFSAFVADLIIWILPAIEITIAFLLIFKSTLTIGFYASFVLMAAFSVYVLLILIHFFPRIPCSCGGLLRQLGWTAHLVFNLFFLALCAIPIYITRQERRSTGTEQN